MFWSPLTHRRWASEYCSSPYSETMATTRPDLKVRPARHVVWGSREALLLSAVCIKDLKCIQAVPMWRWFTMSNFFHVTVICLPFSQRVFMNSLLYVFISFRLLLVSDRYSNIKFSQFPVVNRELSQSSWDFYFFFWISLHLSCCCTFCNSFTIVFKPPIPCLGCLIPLFTYCFLYSDLTLFYRRIVK